MTIQVEIKPDVAPVLRELLKDLVANGIDWPDRIYKDYSHEQLQYMEAHLLLLAVELPATAEHPIA